MKKIVSFFDKLEDKIRGKLSRRPIGYSLLGGILVVLFWRSVWETADILMRTDTILGFILYPPILLVITVTGLLLTGLMVSTFIGDRIILSGLRHEKKMEEQTELLVKEEVVSLLTIREEIRALKKEIEGLKK